ncbi:hypothetical protein [Priestia aryabhattai]|nr:hypothetical protein [Priestia aryabhattai]
MDNVKQILGVLKQEIEMMSNPNELDTYKRFLHHKIDMILEIIENK